MDFNVFLQQIQNRKSLDREMLKLSLFLYNNPLISRKAVDEILNVFNNFISTFFIPYIENEVNIHLKPITSEVSFNKLINILDNSKNLFEKFSTESKRFKEYEEKNLYIPPKLIKIGEDAEVAHVPLGPSLKMLLEMPGVYNQIIQYLHELSANETVVSNFIQGNLWKVKYNNNAKTQLRFPLFLYFDEFETRDPLKSHAGKQKLGGIYASIACLPPHLIGKIQNIFVSGVFYAKYLKELGNELIFGPTIHDVNSLSANGIQILIDQEEHTVYFECVLILGDNLGLNTICGFSRSFNVHIYCRICTASITDCRCMLVENESLLRTVDCYNMAVLKKEFDSIGVYERCVFNDLHNFHIVENITVDVMHDLCEGVAGYTIENLLHCLIEKKILTLKDINDRIEKFNYGDADKNNKPQPLYFTSEKGGKKLKLKQSASELLCLARYLGLMIGYMIPADTKEWKIYIYLRRLIGILTSPILSKGQILSVQELVTKHNYYYLKYFGDLKPKMHLLLHYTRIMLSNGPVVHYSSMKFERKNRKLKEVAIGTSSNVNLPLTIAIRHQLQLAHCSLLSLNTQSDIELGPIDNYADNSLLKQLKPNISDKLPVNTLQYITILGKMFTVGTVFVTRMIDELPCFGILERIFFSDGVYFQTKEYTTQYFNNYYHSYSVTVNDNNSILINVNDVPRTSCCLLAPTRNEILITTRYDL